MSLDKTKAANAEYEKNFIEHESGARRSEKMPYFAAIPANSIQRLACRATGCPRGTASLQLQAHENHTFEYHGGSDGYGYGNWARGLPFEDSLNHVMSHLLNWKANIELGQLPKDDDLAAIAWGVMMPLMTFEKVYAEQYSVRNNMVGEGVSAEAVDTAMRTYCKAEGQPYLLQQLAPVREEVETIERIEHVGEAVVATSPKNAVEGAAERVRQMLREGSDGDEASTRPKPNGSLDVYMREGKVVWYDGARGKYRDLYTGQLVD